MHVQFSLRIFPTVVRSSAEVFTLLPRAGLVGGESKSRKRLQPCLASSIPEARRQAEKIRRNHYYQSKPGRVKIYDVRKCVVRPLKGVQIYCLARWAPQNVMVVVFALGVLTNAFLFIEIFCLSFVIRNLGRMCFFRSSWRQYFLSTKITLEKHLFCVTFKIHELLSGLVTVGSWIEIEKLRNYLSFERVFFGFMSTSSCH